VLLPFNRYARVNLWKIAFARTVGVTVLEEALRK